MPRKTTTPRRRTNLQTPPRAALQALRTGFSVPRVPEDQLPALWASHGPKILRDWIAERPGTRPWAWWVFDAPEARRVLERRPQPEDDDRYQPPWPERGLRFGVPYAWYDYLKVESEPAYLNRLGLLGNEEHNPT